MFELDEYGYMVPVFLPEGHNDFDWMTCFSFVAEISLSVYDDHCDCPECDDPF